MNYTPREPDEPDYEYVEANFDLAVALLDAHGARSIGLIDTVAQLEAELEITRDQREALRSQFLQLQNQIAELLPAHDDDRANDPIINRVKRVAHVLGDLIAYEDGINQREEVYEIEDADYAFSTIRWLMGRQP